MERYRMSDGSVVELSNASAHWQEGTRWDGSNHISLATGSQWNHQTLYRSRKGRYYVVSTSQWQGSTSSAEWVSKEEATRWLLMNEHNPGEEGWPDELTGFVDQVSE